MPQETQEIRDLRRQMREGRTPLLEAIREAYQPYLLARKSLERKNSEVREQLGLLNSTFATSIKKLRESTKSCPALKSCSNQWRKHSLPIVARWMPTLHICSSGPQSSLRVTSVVAHSNSSNKRLSGVCARPQHRPH